MSKVYKKEEFEQLTGTQLQQKVQQIKQRFDQKRGFYHQLRNQPQFIDSWDELNIRIIDFDQIHFTPWNQQWANTQRSNNIPQIITFFENADKFYSEMDEFISSISVQGSHSDEIDGIKKEVLQSIEQDVLKLQATISTEVERGINNLLGLKAELGLQKNFKDNIDAELTTSKTLRFKFMVAFIVTLLFIPITVFSTYSLDMFKDVNPIELYILRAGVTISLGFLSYFLFSQYKLYQVICLRYTHLQGFLGGGATFISQIIGSENGELKQEINKKLAVLFMELEHVFGLAQKSAHPAELTIEKTGELLDKLAKFTDIVKKGS